MRPVQLVRFRGLECRVGLSQTLTRSLVPSFTGSTKYPSDHNASGNQGTKERKNKSYHSCGTAWSPPNRKVDSHPKAEFQGKCESVPGSSRSSPSCFRWCVSGGPCTASVGPSYGTKSASLTG